MFYTHRYLGKLIGFLSIAQAETKPVVVKVDAGPVKRGEIYFRYPAQTTKIEAADLRKIVEEEVQRRVDKLINSIQRINEIGVEKIALLNTENGEIHAGNKDGIKLVLNEKALKNLNLIREGKIVDKEGAPAYIITGEIEIEASASVKPILSKEADIYESFFSQVCEHPDLMLQQLAFSLSQYNPLFFLIHKAGISKQGAVELIEGIDGADVVIKTKNLVLLRINEDTVDTLHCEGVTIDSVNEVIKELFTLDDAIKLVYENHSELKPHDSMKTIRTLAFNNLVNKIPLPEEIYTKHLKRVIEAASRINAQFISQEKDYILSEVQKMYNLISVMGSAESTLIRKIICNVDLVLYLDKILS